MHQDTNLAGGYDGNFAQLTQPRALVGHTGPTLQPGPAQGSSHKTRGICPQHPLASPSLHPTLTVKLLTGCWVWERGFYPLHVHSSFRDMLNHLHVVRKKMRRSMLEPKSNPHGIQADFPQILRWYQPRQFGPKASSNF